ncbi:MAG: type II secretion system protein GspL [Desulfosarcina sp.]
MSRRVLGLEIREASVAGVLLECGFKGSVVQTQGYFPVPAEPPGDEGLKAALQAAVEALKPAGATCVLGIPTAAVSFRNVSVPFHDLKKIRQILPFELEPTLPIPVDELVFDFEAVKRGGNQDLLTFTVEKTQIQRYREILDSVNVRPVVIMPGGYAAARLIAISAEENQNYLMIDSGKVYHAVYAVSQGAVRMVRTLPVDGNGRTVAKSLETALDRTFKALKDNLEIAIEPSAVYSTGSRPQLLAEGNPASTLLGAPIRPLDPIRNFSRLKGSFEAPVWSSGHLDIALALALMEAEAVGGVNFSTERSTIQHYLSEYRTNIILTAVLIVMTLATVLGGQALAVNAKKRQLTELDRQIEMVFRSTFPDVARVEAPLQQMQIKIKAAGDGSVAPELSGARARVIDILNALSQQIPATLNVQVGRMVMGVDNVVLSGSTDTFNTVDDIKGRLENADIFKNVVISSADMEKSGTQVRFKLKLDF